MKAISFTFDNFDFVVDAFEHTGADGVVGVIEYPIFEIPQLLHERPDCSMVDAFSHRTPIIQRLPDLLTVAVVIQKLELILENINTAEGMIEFQQRRQSILLFTRQVVHVFEQQVSAVLDNLSVVASGPCVFAASNLVNNPAKTLHHVEKVKDDFRPRAVVSDPVDIRLPHIHCHGLNCVFLACGKNFEERIERFLLAALAHPDDSTAEKIRHDVYVLMPFMNVYLNEHHHPQIVETVPSEELLQKRSPWRSLVLARRFVKVFDVLRINIEMLCDVLSCEHIAQLLNVSVQPVCVMLPVVVKSQSFNAYAAAIAAPYFSVINLQKDDVEFSNEPDVAFEMHRFGDASALMAKRNATPGVVLSGSIKIQAEDASL